MAEDVVDHLLTVARGIIHVENIVGNKPERFQTAIIKHGIILPTTALISSDNDDVAEEALALLVELLNGGNVEGQQAFLDYFTNTNEDTFFIDVADMLKNDMQEIQEVCTVLLQPTIL